MDDLQRLARAAAKSRADDTRADRSRAERNALIVDTLDLGVSQAAVCRATGLTREHIRRITDAERRRRTELASSASPAPPPEPTTAG